jgi:hypothetical protein
MQSATFDTSFWINAFRSGLTPHLLGRYDLRYTPEVAGELFESSPGGREFWRLVREGALVTAMSSAQPVREFGAGERAAINLAFEHQDWLLLMDDYRPFQAAVQLGLRVVCTPVLAVALYHEGRLGAEGALALLARLAAMQTVSPHLLAAALAQLAASRRAGPRRQENVAD